MYLAHLNNDGWVSVFTSCCNLFSFAYLHLQFLITGLLNWAGKGWLWLSRPCFHWMVSTMKLYHASCKSKRLSWRFILKYGCSHVLDCQIFCPQQYICASCDTCHCLNYVADYTIHLTHICLNTCNSLSLKWWKLRDARSFMENDICWRDWPVLNDYLPGVVRHRIAGGHSSELLRPSRLLRDTPNMDFFSDFRCNWACVQRSPSVHSI